ncbi:MAG TPA: hypothetical protein VMI11_13655 [Actinomycetes bacterium]|nr:hypothetical protein [Actinomycetes bacterium]
MHRRGGRVGRRLVALLIAALATAAVPSVAAVGSSPIIVPAQPLPGSTTGPAVLVYEDHVPAAQGPQEVIADVQVHAEGKPPDDMFSVIIACAKQTFVETTNTVGHKESRLRPHFFMDDVRHCTVRVQSGHGRSKHDYLVVDEVTFTRKTFASYAIGFDPVGTGRLLEPGRTLDTTAASLRTTAPVIAVVADTKVTACTEQTGSRERDGPNICPPGEHPKAVAHVRFTLYAEQVNADGTGYCEIAPLSIRTEAIDHKLHHVVEYQSSLFTLSQAPGCGTRVRGKVAVRNVGHLDVVLHAGGTVVLLHSAEHR